MLELLVRVGGAPPLRPGQLRIGASKLRILAGWALNYGPLFCPAPALVPQLAR